MSDTKRAVFWVLGGLLVAGIVACALIVGTTAVTLWQWVMTR